MESNIYPDYSNLKMPLKNIMNDLSNKYNELKLNGVKLSKHILPYKNTIWHLLNNVDTSIKLNWDLRIKKIGLSP